MVKTQKRQFQLSNNLSPAIQAQLAEAQKQADLYNQGKASFDSFNSGESFDLQNELRELQQNNIIDKDWEQTVSKELTQMKTPVQMEQDAMATAGFSAPEKQVNEEIDNKEKDNDVNQKEPELTEEQKLGFVSQAFKKYPNCPTVEQLKQWKAIHGGLFFLNIDEDNIYLYRYLKKVEYQQMLADEQYNSLDPLKKAVFLVRKCVLFPPVDNAAFNAKPAGTSEMLAQQIELRSLFLDASAVAQMTIKL